MSNTYDRLPSSWDATPHALATEVQQLRDEALMQSREAASLRVHIGELKQQLDAAHEATEDALLGNADRIEALEGANASLKRLLGNQLHPRVAAAALLYKEITGREQPMDRTAEDILAEITHAVRHCESITWATPVTLTYIVKVSGHVDEPNYDQVVMFEQVNAKFSLSTTDNPRFHHLTIGSVDFDGVQYG